MSKIEKSHPGQLEIKPNVEMPSKTSENSKKSQQVSVSQFSGPIPPPSYLEHYERLVPGTAKRFLEEPHIEAEHRRSLEKRMVDEQIKASHRGQVFAFVLALLGILGSFAAIYLGRDLAGFGTLFLSIAALVGVFYSAQKKSQ